MLMAKSKSDARKSKYRRSSCVFFFSGELSEERRFQEMLANDKTTTPRSSRKMTIKKSRMEYAFKITKKLPAHIGGPVESSRQFPTFHSTDAKMKSGLESS